MTKRVLIFGGTGFLGLSLAQHLEQRGLTPVLVARNKVSTNYKLVLWDGMMDRKREISIGEFDQSIIQLQKHKFKLLEQVEQINLQISFLRQQQEQLINV